MKAIEGLIGQPVIKDEELARQVLRAGSIDKKILEDLVAKMKRIAPKGAQIVYERSNEPWRLGLLEIQFEAVRLGLTTMKSNSLIARIYDLPQPNHKPPILYATYNFSLPINWVEVWAPIDLIDPWRRDSYQRQLGEASQGLLPVTELLPEAREARLIWVGECLADITTPDTWQKYFAFLAAVSHWWPEFRFVLNGFLESWTPQTSSAAA